MYTAIIVDDETWICKLIRKIVPWEEMGFSLVAETGNGRTALELVEKHRPDLIITDIRMPGLDGISLIKAVRENEIDAEFIIISGYSDFEYARSAVTYNAFGYLLKPLGKEEFENILLSVREKIDAKRTVKDKIEFGNKKMLEQVVLNIINRTDTGTTCEALNKNYGTKLKDGLFKAAVLKIDPIARERFDGDLSHIYRSFLDQVKKTYSDVFYDIIYIGGNEKTIAVLNYDPAQSERADRIAKDIVAQSIGLFHNGFQLTIGLGSTAKTLSELGASCRAAENAVRARAFYGCGKVIDAKNTEMAEIKKVIDIQDEKKLEMCFDVFDTANASPEILRIFKKAQKAYLNNALIDYLTAVEIIGILYAAMGRKDINMDSVPDKEEALLGLDECATREAVEKYVCNQYKAFNDAYEGERQNNGNKIINEIKVFVTTNYMQDIGLDDIARLVCLNSTYISEIFKKKTGENFSDYLIGYRISIAKNLLKDVKYKVIDVSQMVGYKDPKYFSRIFKQKVGVNPTDYRNLYV